MNKYHAKYVYWNTVTRTVLPPDLANSLRSGKQKQLPKYVRRFDSRHEFKVYLELVRIYGEQRVRTQVHVDLLPPGLCFPRGKKWKVDFAVTEQYEDDAFCTYVEAKGIVTREFIYTLSCLEAYKPLIFNNLRLVFITNIPTENLLIKNLSKTHWKQNILTLEDLKNTHQYL